MLAAQVGEMDYSLWWTMMDCTLWVPTIHRCARRWLIFESESSRLWDRWGSPRLLPPTPTTPYMGIALSLERACRSKCQKYEKFERESSPRKGFDSVPNLLKISKNCIDGPWPFAGGQTSGLQTIDITYKSIEIRARPRESRQTDVLRGVPAYQSRSQHLSRSKSRRKWWQIDDVVGSKN